MFNENDLESVYVVGQEITDRNLGETEKSDTNTMLQNPQIKISQPFECTVFHSNPILEYSQVLSPLWEGLINLFECSLYQGYIGNEISKAN